MNRWILALALVWACGGGSGDGCARQSDVQAVESYAARLHNQQVDEMGMLRHRIEKLEKQVEDLEHDVRYGR